MRYVILLLIVLVATYVSAFDTIIAVSVPSGSFGDFPVWVIDSSYNERSELYLGESFYLVFDLRKFSGTLYVEIREGGSLIAAGTVNGGYVYGYRMTIVEPIYEGKLYTYKVTVWDANTKALLGSASASYVEKYCPDMQISDVSWDSFVYGRSATVRVAVRNLGERGWTYTVEAWTEGGSAGRGSASVSVPAGGGATATLSLPVTSFKSASDTLVVRVSCAGGRKYVDKRYSVTVTPPRPGPFEFSASPVEARLGQEVVFSVGLKNLGYDAELVSLTLSEGRYSADLPGRVSAGSSASVQVRFTPTRAGEYSVTLKLRYRSPVTGEAYEDSASLSVRVYVRLSVSVWDHMGRPVSVTPTIDGKQTSELWVLPGRHEVSIPAEVSVSSSEKLVFSRWSTGQYTASAAIDVDDNVEVKAMYNRIYKITLDLRPALPYGEEWAMEGDHYSKDVPRYVPMDEGSRWVLAGLYVDGRQVSSVSFTVSGPASVSASWAKEYKVVVDCGQVACLGRDSRLEQWVREGDKFSVDLAPYVDVSPRERWRLEGQQSVELTVERPATITPRYVKQYLINFGFKVKTVAGAESTTVLQREWRDAGASVTVVPEALKPQEAPGISYRLALIEVDGQPGSSAFTVSRPHDVYVVWDKYFYVKVTTPVGSASGSGWYFAGSVAKVELDRTVSGFLVEDVFRKWVDDRGAEYRNATVILTVDRPIVMYAVWDKDYAKALALAGGLSASGIVAWRRKEVINTISTFTRRLGTKSKKIDLEPIQEGETKVWAKEETEEKWRTKE
jgi:hypothetical protein